jgi:tripartite-type tricarboxylate transporter receptor subunit TctC
VRARLAADGTEVVANTPAEFATLLRTEYARWGKLIRDAGLQAE